jgi:hypothetical protein
MKKSDVFEWCKQFKGASMSESQIKRVLITFFRIKDIVHFEFIPQGQTVNQAYYVEILKQLHEAVCRKRPEVRPNNWIFHHDHAAAHKVLSVKQFLAQKLITEMEHTPLSTDLAVNDFWLI